MAGIILLTFCLASLFRFLIAISTQEQCANITLQAIIVNIKNRSQVYKERTLEGKHVLFETLGSPGVYILAAGQGFEPRYADPESAVLPLDEPAICVFYHMEVVK